MNLRLTLLSTLVLVLLLAGACGGSSQVDPAPFKAAMQADFDKRKYGVSIGEISEIQIKGNSATLKVRVTHKESTGMKPQWTVSLKKSGDGWTVVTIKRK